MKRFFFILAFFACLSFCLVGPINRTPLHERDFYKDMQTTFDTLKIIPSPKGKLKVGWSSFGIIPDHALPMAGYAPRDHFDSVHDSLYTKILSISNGYTTSYLITIDLLIFPPALKQLVEARIKSAADFVYLSASHTHSGLGGWNESTAGQFIVGNYNEKWLETLADSIISNMNNANYSSLPASLSYWETDASEYVSNRLEENGKTDGKLRGIQAIREDSLKAILFTYSAHPTNIDHLSKILSGDYPNATNKALEKKGFAFSIFMAGMMGSHRLDHVEGSDYELVNNAAEKLRDKIKDALVSSKIDSASITHVSIDLPMGSSQLRITNNWKLRDWLFTAALGKLEATITYLKIGDILFLGTSCDFSGEIAVTKKLDELANKQGTHLIITSFNGNYTGYITDDIHYDHAEKEEVRAMNWVGPYYGTYYSEIVNLLIQK
jgi:neutral ceramidase